MAVLIFHQILYEYGSHIVGSHVLELHLYEGHINPCGTFRDWITGWIKSAEKTISKTWEASARVLLDQIFQKWEPSNQETIREFAQHLNHYQKGFMSACQRIFYPGHFCPPQIKVKERNNA